MMRYLSILLIFCCLSVCAEEKKSSNTSNVDYIIFTVNGVSFKMIKVAGGTFTMGGTEEQGNDAQKNEKPTHLVTLSDYYIGETEVTQELWAAVLFENPSCYKENKNPVESIDWNDCQKFINKLNILTGKQFRLPTEAEWEYAARGGKKSRKYKYAGGNTLNDVAWYYENSGANQLNDSKWSADDLYNNNCKPHPVATKRSNELGLYDMSGNVWEWCQDWYGACDSNTQQNPVGAASSFNRVARGGCWDNETIFCRITMHYGTLPEDNSEGMGLRLCLIVK